MPDMTHVYVITGDMVLVELDTIVLSTNSFLRMLSNRNVYHLWDSWRGGI
jgi:hypothetical protein